MIRLLRLFPYVRQLEADSKKLRADLTSALCGELTIEKIAADNKTCSVELGTKMAGFLATSFYDMLDTVKAENYIEISFLVPHGKPVTVTIRRHEGMTPDQLYREALARAEKAEMRRELSESELW